MKKLLRVLTVTGTLFLGLAFMSCSGTSNPNSNNNTTPSGDTGTVNVSVSEKVSRLIAPTLSMTPTTYAISGVGPNGYTFSQTLTLPASTYNSPTLPVGSWTVTVDAFNAANIRIGTGFATTTVIKGATTPVNIAVLPVIGTGTLNLTVNWPDQLVSNPSIKASLVPFSTSAKELEFEIRNGRGTHVENNLANGYYTLILQLFDKDVLVNGTVDVVRIVSGQTTFGTITYTENQLLNQKGSLTVNITVNMQNPLVVNMLDETGKLITGTVINSTSSAKLKLSAKLDAINTYSGNVIYTWYIGDTKDGRAIAVGSDATFTGLEMGLHNVTVTAFSVDGTQAGSALAQINITSNQ